MEPAERMSSEHIEERSGELYVKGTRVTLASVILEFRDGTAPETILQDFPALVSLENVYGAITYALANQSTVEEYLKARAEKWEEFRKSAHPMPPTLAARLEGTRR